MRTAATVPASSDRMSGALVSRKADRRIADAQRRARPGQSPVCAHAALTLFVSRVER